MNGLLWKINRLSLNIFPVIFFTEQTIGQQSVKKKTSVSVVDKNGKIAVEGSWFGLVL